MIDIRPLRTFDLSELNRVMPGYTSAERYEVQFTESDDGRRVNFELTLRSLPQPFVKRWDVEEERNDETIADYTRMVQAGLSRAAYDGEVMIAIALAEIHPWNQTLWISEFGVAQAYRGRGIGLQLINGMVEAARQAGQRMVGLEVQNSNVPAIRFYRRAGFDFDGIRLAFYTNNDLERGEVALFMRRTVDMKESS